MSIVLVEPDWEGRRGRMGINPDTLRPEGEFSCPYNVLFSDGDPSFKPLAAIYAPGLPIPYQTLEGFPWAYVVDYDAVQVAPLRVKVTVKYKVYEDPLAIEPIIRYDFATDTDEIHKAIKPRESPYDTPVEMVLANSAGETPETVVVKDYRDLLIIVDVNRASFDPLVAAEYIDSVNADTFMGFSPGKVKCKVYSGEPARAGALSYFKVRYEFQARTFKSDPLDIGWRRRFLDEGFKKLTYTEGEAKKSLKMIMLPAYEYDSTGAELTETKKFVPVSRPMPLDGEGNTIDPNYGTNHYIEFEDFDYLPFSTHFGLG